MSLPAALPALTQWWLSDTSKVIQRSYLMALGAGNMNMCYMKHVNPPPTFCPSTEDRLLAARSLAAALALSWKISHQKPRVRFDIEAHSDSSYLRL
jgi:hypothetical protein